MSQITKASVGATTTMDLSTSDLSLTHGQLFDAWKSVGKKEKLEKVINEFRRKYELPDKENATEGELEELNKFGRLVCSIINTKYEKRSRNVNNVLTYEKEWLQRKISLPPNLLPRKPIPQKDEPNESSHKFGRPLKNFTDCCDKTKTRKVGHLIEEFSAEELQYAAGISNSNPPIDVPKKNQLSVHQTLALCLDLDLSERKYNILRDMVNNVEAGIFPSLYSLNLYKKQFFPEIVHVSETSVELSVQNMLNKTVTSIFNLITDKIADAILSDFVLLCKWGMDGSSGHSTYKQSFEEVDQTDEFLFFIAFVPILMKEKHSGVIIWKNEHSNSSLYCRPLKFVFSKENEELIRNEYSKFEKIFETEIKACNVKTENKTFNVSFQFHLTMIDGSVCSKITETASCATCYICGAKPSDMNKIDLHKFIPDSKKYGFGLSVLHCWIRFLECCLSIAFRLSFKKWRVTEEFKAAHNTSKQTIQHNFKQLLGLNISKPKHSHGSTNDGNTARAFFKNFKLSAQITGLNEQLLFKFYTILRLLNCKTKLDLSKFKRLTDETLQCYLKHYSWYPMPMTVHKILVHGYDVMSHFEIPIGYMAEDCLESRHKEIRRERLSHTRKTSRKESNVDLMNRLVITSDPFLASFRKSATNKASMQHDSDIQEYLLTSPNVAMQGDIDVSSCLNTLATIA